MWRSLTRSRLNVFAPSQSFSVSFWHSCICMYKYTLGTAWQGVMADAPSSECLSDILESSWPRSDVELWGSQWFEFRLHEFVWPFFEVASSVLPISNTTWRESESSISGTLRLAAMLCLPKGAQRGAFTGVNKSESLLLPKSESLTFGIEFNSVSLSSSSRNSTLNEPLSSCTFARYPAPTEKPLDSILLKKSRPESPSCPVGGIGKWELVWLKNCSLSRTNKLSLLKLAVVECERSVVWLGFTL